MNSRQANANPADLYQVSGISDRVDMPNLYTSMLSQNLAKVNSGPLSPRFLLFGEGGRNKPKHASAASAYFDHLRKGGRNKPRPPFSFPEFDKIETQAMNMYHARES